MNLLISIKKETKLSSVQFVNQQYWRTIRKNVLRVDRVIGSIFLEHVNERAVADNRGRYRRIIKDFW